MVLITVRVLHGGGRQVLVAGRRLHAHRPPPSREVLGVLGLQRLALATEAPGPAAKASLLEHVLRGRVDGPVVALAGSPQTLGQLDEALVQAQVVADRVLPSLIGAPEEGEVLLEEGVDLG